MAGWREKLTREFIRECAYAVLWSFWPYWGAPLVGGVLLYIQGYSLGEIFLAVLFAFAMVALALNNLSHWMETRTPADKVRITVPQIGVVVQKTSDKVRGVKLGIAVQNIAQFPIEVQIDNLETQIADKVPSQAFYSRSMTIGQKASGSFSNSIINLSPAERRNKLLYGRIKADISYGRPGRLRHTAEQQFYLAMKFDKDGNFANAEVSNTEFSKEDAA